MTNKKKIKAVFVISIVICIFVLVNVIDYKEKITREAETDAIIDTFFAEEQDANDQLDIIIEHLDKLNTEPYGKNGLLKLVYTDSNGVETILVEQCE
ncbi:unnamed protein product [marine sediment metagenome]|uniref:Uncharacterized protein n=1 Tax=marine sediment metagenome TaxID=412755 RepID=X1LKE9_9ZZZZ